MYIKEKSSRKNFLTGMKRILAVVFVTLSPAVVFAQSNGIFGLFDLSQSFLNRAVVLVISIAVVYFMWNVFQYAIAGDEAKKAEAKSQMIWGIVGIFVMVSVWGLVAILQSTFRTTGFNSAMNTSNEIQNLIPKFK